MTDDLYYPQQWRDNIETRFGTLEARVGPLEATVKPEAHLRATTDSPSGKLLSELRVRRSMLQALLDTQQDGTRRLMRIEDQLTRVENQITGVEGQLTGVEERPGGVGGRLTNIEGMLELVRAGVEAIHGKLDLLIDRI